MSNATLILRLVPVCAILGAGVSALPAWADSPAATAAVAKYDKDSDKTLDINEVKAE